MNDQVIDPTIYNEVKDLMEDSMADFVRTYLTNSPQLIAGLEQALTLSNAEDVYHNAHQLKGGSGSIGATKLAELALNIEKIGKAGSTEGVEPLLAELKQEYAQVEQVLKQQL